MQKDPRHYNDNRNLSLTKINHLDNKDMENSAIDFQQVSEEIFQVSGGQNSSFTENPLMFPSLGNCAEIDAKAKSKHITETTAIFHNSNSIKQNRDNTGKCARLQVHRIYLIRLVQKKNFQNLVVLNLNSFLLRTARLPTQSLKPLW